MLWVAFMEALGNESLEYFLHHYGAHEHLEHEHEHDDQDHNGTAHSLLRVASTVGRLATASARRLHAGDGDNNPGETSARLTVLMFFTIGAVLNVGFDKFSDMIIAREQAREQELNAEAMAKADADPKPDEESIEMEVKGVTHDREVRKSLVNSASSFFVEKEASPDMGVKLREDDHDHGHGHAHANFKRVSMLAFIALTLHNFPEGLATFFSGATGSFGIVFAVTVHNIPEGAAIAIPLQQVTGRIWPAIGTTFIAGMAQPFGAMVGWIALAALGLDKFPDFLNGAMLALTSGIMISISVLGLLPEALQNASPLYVFCAVLVGFIVMELSLILFSAI